MKEEVKSAGDFLAKLLRMSDIEPERATNFSQVLQSLLCNHYSNHWFPEKPFKGSAYRCLRINSNKMEPLINTAFKFCGVTDSQVDRSLPCELTLWIDPKEVSYRIGENGSVCVLYSENGNSFDESNSGDTDSSLTSPESSPSTSPVKNLVNFPSPVNHGNNGRYRRNRSHFKRSRRVDNTDVSANCADNWLTMDQSQNIPKIATYVYS